MFKSSSFILAILALALKRTAAQDINTPMLTKLSTVSEPYILAPPLDCTSSTTDFANAVNSVHGNVTTGTMLLINSSAPPGKVFAGVRIILKPDSNCVYTTVINSTINSTRTLYQDGPANSACYDFNALGENIALPSTQAFGMVFKNENGNEDVCLVDAHFDFDFEDAPEEGDNSGGTELPPPPEEEEDPIEVPLNNTDPSAQDNTTTNTEEQIKELTEKMDAEKSVKASGRGPSVEFSAATRLTSTIYMVIIGGFFGALNLI